MTLLNEKDAKALTQILCKYYKDAKYYLCYKTPIDLLAAAILSAQTKDDVVNALTPELFKKYKTAKDYANADEKELLKYVKRVSFADKKTKNIIEANKIIERDYKGKLPNSMKELLKLPGIGRKTANTILINAYGIVEGIPVDTWVIKLSYRLGLSTNKNPDKIEQDLMKVVDRNCWHNFAYVIKSHGKALCNTIPICSKCPIEKLCPKNNVTKRL
ncbi:MAG: endonuclease III [Candidatus Marsarchaeota archaeon]|jgi:endonuclease-3|nr:endonuclease III [Candidatus Marsarchaeota archaeon]